MLDTKESSEGELQIALWDFVVKTEALLAEEVGHFL